MKCRNKSALVLSLLAVMTISGTTACSIFPNSSEQPSGSENSSTESVVTATLTLDKTSLQLDLYTSATITASLENSEEVIVWSSSDESVAKVVDGVVTAYKAGTATITATAGDLEAMCTVTIGEPTELPEFTELPEELTLIKGTTEELDAVMMYASEIFTMATVTFETTGNVVSVSEDGVITAADYGTQDVVVKAFVNGTEIASETITVTVIEYGIVSVDLPANTLNFVLGGEEMFVDYSLSNVKAQINGIDIENPEFTVTSANEDVAKVQDSKIVAQNVGTTTLEVSYVSESNQTYSVVLTVNVAKGKIVKETNFLIKGDAALNTSDTGNSAVDLTATGIDLSKVTAVTCNDTAVTYTVEGSVLKFSNAPCGEQVYVLETSNVDYYINGCIYTNEVSNKEEFLNWRANANDIHAYTILTADIDLGGMTLPNSDAWMRNIFDGRGHTIANFRTQQGFMTNYSEKGGIKNLQLVNVVLEEMSGNGHKYGFLGMEMCGTLENILIIGRTERTGDLNGLIYTCTHSGSVGKNIIAIVENSSVKYQWGLGAQYAPGGALCENIYIVSTKDAAMEINADIVNCAYFTDVEAMLNGAEFSVFDGLWNVEENKVPYMSDYTTYLENPSVTLSGSSVAGSTMTFSNTCAYGLTYSIKEPIEGVVIENGVLTIGENVAHETEITVVVTCSKLPNFSKEFTVTVDNSVAVVHMDGLKSALVQDGKVTLALADYELTAVDKLTINDTETAFTAENGVITFDATTGDNVVGFIVDRTQYTYSIAFADYIITTSAELESWRANAGSYEYAVLGNDIDMKGATLATNQANWYKKVFDGRGYTIANFTTSTGFTSNVDGSGLIKNVQLINVSLEGMGADVGIFGDDMCGAIENVLVKVVAGRGGWHNGVLFSRAHNTTVRNVVVIADGLNDQFTSPMAGYGVFGTTNVDNFHFIGVSTTGDHGGDGSISLSNVSSINYTNSAVYDTVAEFLAKADLTKFGSPWKVTAAGVYMNDYSSFIPVEGLKSALVQDGKVTLTLADYELTAVDKLTINGTETAFAAENGAITFDATTGDNVVVFTVGETQYTYSIAFADYIITTPAELESWRANANSYAYAVLGNNIDMKGATLVADQADWYKKVFDGRGYTIANFTTTTGFIKNLDGTGVVKNVQLINVKMLTGSDQGLFGDSGCGTIENVLIKVTEGPGRWHNGMLFSKAYDSSVVRNVIFIAEDLKDCFTAPMAGYGVYDYMAVADNFHFIGVSTTADHGGDGSICFWNSSKINYTNSAVHDTVAEFLANADLTKFGSPWKVTATGIYMTDYSSFVS